MSRLGNGTGSVYKLSGNRKKPWTARKTIGFKLNGQPIYRYIGYYRTKAEAMTALIEYNKAPYSLDKETIESIYDKFIIGYTEHQASKSVADLKSHWKKLEPLYDKPIASLSRRELQLFFDNLECSSAVKERVKIVLKHLYDYAIRYDIIQPERVAILKYIDLSSNIEINKNKRDRFTDEEIEQLWKIDDEMSRILLFLIYTGLRAGEFCKMAPEKIDKNMVIHVGKAKTPAGVREVPLSDKAQGLLPMPFFGEYSVFYYKYKQWREKHGFEHRDLHCTRYTTISLLVTAKVDDRIIKAIVGHKSGDVTSRVYTKITNEEKRIALNKI